MPEMTNNTVVTPATATNATVVDTNSQEFWAITMNSMAQTIGQIVAQSNAEQTKFLVSAMQQNNAALLDALASRRKASRKASYEEKIAKAKFNFDRGCSEAFQDAVRRLGLKFADCEFCWNGNVLEIGVPVSKTSRFGLISKVTSLGDILGWWSKYKKFRKETSAYADGEFIVYQFKFTELD